MKKFGAICLIICLLIAVLCPEPVSAVMDVTDDKSVQQGCHTIDAQSPLLGSMPFTENAKSIILYECNSDTLMYAWNADEQLYPASFVKIMTALIAVEKGDLSAQVTVRQDVLNTLPNDAVSAELVSGERISLEDLLYCMMVQSANDAAAVIADHISGSQEAFVAEMNAYAQQLGCTGTKFMNVHGLHHEEQVTTARDTARILAVAMQNEDFAKIFNTAFYTVPATNKSASRRLETVNHLINNQEYATYYDERVTGGRTGVTDDGYRCIASASQADDLQMISVIMGTQSVFAEDGYTPRIVGGFLETSELLDMGYAGYKEAQILYKGQIIKQQAVTNGTSDVMLGCQIDVSTVLPYSATENDLVYRYNDVPGAFQAPITKGEILSQIEIWYGSICLGHADLIAMNNVDAVQTETQTDANSRSGSTAGKIVLWIFLGILAVLVVIVLCLVVIRKLRKALIGHRGKKYRRSRRRSR